MQTKPQLREIAAELRRLQASSPSDKEALAAWYADSRQFAERLNSQYTEIDLPEEVWHYLHDADLRIKDPKHKQLQDEMLDGVVADLERGIVPKPRGSSVALHPRWLGVAGMVLVALILYWATR